jgi:hypothetical protein
MRKLIVAGALAVLTIGAGGTAFAGEITGSGQGGPEGDGVTGAVANANSECLYSGLDDADVDTETGEDDFGRTQSYGQIVRQTGSLGGIPGQACNGHLSPRP